MLEKDVKCLAEKKKAIFESTLRLIKENGFHGTPMSQVAKNAGVACGTIYHYFDSKDALMVELYRYIREQLTDALLAGDNANLPIRDRLFSFWLNHFRFYSQNPDYLFFVEQYVNSPYIVRFPLPYSERFEASVMALIKEGVLQGVFKPFSHDLIGIILHNNVILTSKLFLNSRLMDDDVEKMFNIIWDGIRNNLKPV